MHTPPLFLPSIALLLARSRINHSDPSRPRCICSPRGYAQFMKTHAGLGGKPSRNAKLPGQGRPFERKPWRGFQVPALPPACPASAGARFRLVAGFFLLVKRTKAANRTSLAAFLSLFLPSWLRRSMDPGSPQQATGPASCAAPCLGWAARWHRAKRAKRSLTIIANLTHRPQRCAI